MILHLIFVPGPPNRRMTVTNADIPATLPAGAQRHIPCGTSSILPGLNRNSRYFVM